MIYMYNLYISPAGVQRFMQIYIPTGPADLWLYPHKRPPQQGGTYTGS